MATGSQQYSALNLIRTNIDDVLNVGYERQKSFGNFLEGLQISGITAGDLDRVIVGGRFPSGSSFQGAQLLPSTSELYATLSDSQRAQLREHYFGKLNSIKAEFPELCAKFEAQLR